MNWRLDKRTRRLHVSDAQLDFRPIRALIGRGWVPVNVEAIIFSTPAITYVVCGFVLREWIAGRDPSAREPATRGS